MFVAELTFSCRHAPTDETFEAVEGLLAVLYKNGQVVTRIWPVTSEGALLRAVVLTPAEDALESRHHNRYVLGELARLDEQGLAPPTVNSLGPERLSLPECSCGDWRAGLLLYTDFLSLEPPVRCLDCFHPVALYRLPRPESGEHLGLLGWQTDYQACDTLQMHTMTGERFGERQLGQLQSALSRHGRGIASTLSEAMSVPVYYYLHRSRARSLRAELSRLCPGCGAAWRLTSPLHERFDFRCERCALLSNIACSVRHRLVETIDF
ncbi:MAG: DUF2310 family Zn-ribbon-containing protein [Myxococcales bacterium]|nr:DUF2310 family Zn-ribbon-containing protein [Myxococcales bacterium]